MSESLRVEYHITCSFWSGQEQAPFLLQWQQKFEQIVRWMGQTAKKQLSAKRKISFTTGLPVETFEKT